MPIQMKLSRIVISDVHTYHFIYLHEVDGDREFPIVIGFFEATSIERRVKNAGDPPRPLTHDLVIQAIERMGGELDSVMITELQKETYFATLRIKRDGEIVELDSRPSDAIAIAVSTEPNLPIYVAEEVLEEALTNDEEL